MGKQKSRQAEERRTTGDWRRRKVKGSERKRVGWGGVNTRRTAGAGDTAKGRNIIPHLGGCQGLPHLASQFPLE